MFAVSSDERSVGSVEGDMECKRNRLLKLHHAATCWHEGYTPATHCTREPHCCATKRVFEHMVTCMNGACGVPTCRSCRRIWRHYRKCRHVKNCPLCSVIGRPYSSDQLAPRFRKMQETPSVVSSASSMAPTVVSQESTDAVMTTPAQVGLPIRKRFELAKAELARAGKENLLNRGSVSSSPSNKSRSGDNASQASPSPGGYGWVAKSSVPPRPVLAYSNKKSPSAAAAAAAAAQTTNTMDTSRTTKSNKPPLSPRRLPIGYSVVL